MRSFFIIAWVSMSLLALKYILSLEMDFKWFLLMYFWFFIGFCVFIGILSSGDD